MRVLEETVHVEKAPHEERGDRADDHQDQSECCAIGILAVFDHPMIVTDRDLHATVSNRLIIDRRRRQLRIGETTAGTRSGTSTPPRRLS